MKNIEIKLRITESDAIRIREELIRECDEYYFDQQDDHYFDVPGGRLKFRISENETALIQYDRAEEWPKLSNYNLFRFDKDGMEEKVTDLLTILQKSLSTKVVVSKSREVFFVGRAKIHIDKVEGLPDQFLEIEIRDEEDNVPEKVLREELDEWVSKYNLERERAVNCSYSDLLLVE